MIAKGYRLIVVIDPENAPDTLEEFGRLVRDAIIDYLPDGKKIVAVNYIDDGELIEVDNFTEVIK